MKTFLLSIVLLAISISFAAAAVRISGDDGGRVTDYLQRYNKLRQSGERVIIDGPCLSACTLLTGMVPRDHICVTPRAMLGFHSSFYDTAPWEPSRWGNRAVMRLYPPAIRYWIAQHGGLSMRVITLSGRDLEKIYHVCR